MANETIKAAQIVEAAVLLLQREIVLPRLVWRQADANFVGALDDTITLRVPAVLSSRSRVMRSTTALTFDEFAETAVPVKLDTHVYSGLKIKDEELTLDIRDFAAQVVAPQMRAVAEGMENVIAAELTAADSAYDDIDFVEGTDDPYKVLVEARRVLNAANVPAGDRIFLAGSNVEAAILGDDKLRSVSESGAGATDALTEGMMFKRLAGFTVVSSNAIDPDEAFAFHKTAIAFANVAPSLPDGAASKARVNRDNLALRFLRDYAPENSTGPVDRSLVDSFVGAVSVEEGDDAENNRLVKIAFTAEGS